jgi:hypothetical protein
VPLKCRLYKTAWLANMYLASSATRGWVQSSSGNSTHACRRVCDTARTGEQIVKLPRPLETSSMDGRGHGMCPSGVEDCGMTLTQPCTICQPERRLARRPWPNKDGTFCSSHSNVAGETYMGLIAAATDGANCKRPLCIGKPWECVLASKLPKATYTPMLRN